MKNPTNQQAQALFIVIETIWSAVTLYVGHVSVDCKVITMATSIHPSLSCLFSFYTIPIFHLSNDFFTCKYIHMYTFYPFPVLVAVYSGSVCILNCSDFLCAGATMSPTYLPEGGEHCHEEQPTTPLPQFIEDWLHTFTSWPAEHKSLALNAIISA